MERSGEGGMLLGDDGSFDGMYDDERLMMGPAGHLHQGGGPPGMMGRVKR